MANNIPVTMKLSGNGYKKLRGVMKKLGFNNEDLFLKYCVLRTIRPKVSSETKKEIDWEVRKIQAARTGR
ncbi:hypothetical protein HYV84_02575 [Candidatus Woesearchaeota archaeon]|nr:hypothetical protein [Candidatus Woesearchaeota archaeon]